jgi:Amt family ammonium transporter
MSALENSTEICFGSPGDCPDFHTECFARENSACGGVTYSDRYDDASATWVVLCAILMFFMKAGFLYVEVSFSKTEKRRRVVLAASVFVFQLEVWKCRGLPF